MRRAAGVAATAQLDARLHPNGAQAILGVVRVAQPPPAVHSHGSRCLPHSRGHLCHTHLIRLKCHRSTTTEVLHNRSVV